MSTTTLTISADQTGTAYTADLNAGLAAINTCHSGNTAPTEDLFAGKFWLDTAGSNPILKIYRTGWKSLFTLKAGSVDMSVANIAATLVTATNVNTTSDERLKDNIKTILNPLEKVINLRGVSYTMEGVRKIGVVAQEVEEVIPEVVSTDAQGIKSVSYGNIVGLLIEAVKEQQEQINELKELLEK